MAAWTLLLCKLVSSFAVRIYGTDAEIPGTSENQDQMCQTLTAEMNLEDEDAIFKLASEAILGKHHADSVAVLRCLNNHLNATGPLKQSLLFPAVESGNLRALDFLIESGVPVALRNRQLVSAAEEALMRNQKNPGKCLELLLDAGLDPNEPSPRKCKYKSKKLRTCSAKWTLAHYATRYNATVLPILKKDRADMNRKDLMGFSPAHVAVREGDLGAVLELQKLNASAGLSDQ